MDVFAFPRGATPLARVRFYDVGPDAARAVTSSSFRCARADERRHRRILRVPADAEPRVDHMVVTSRARHSSDTGSADQNTPRWASSRSRKERRSIARAALVAGTPALCSTVRPCRSTPVRKCSGSLAQPTSRFAARSQIGSRSRGGSSVRSPRFARSSLFILCRRDQVKGYETMTFSRFCNPLWREDPATSPEGGCAVHTRCPNVKTSCSPRREIHWNGPPSRVEFSSSSDRHERPQGILARVVSTRESEDKHPSLRRSPRPAKRRRAGA